MKLENVELDKMYKFKSKKRCKELMKPENSYNKDIELLYGRDIVVRRIICLDDEYIDNKIKVCLADDEKISQYVPADFLKK